MSEENNDSSFYVKTATERGLLVGIKIQLFICMFPSVVYTYVK